MDTIGKRIAWARRRMAVALGVKTFGQGKLAEACGWGKDKRQRISMYEKDQREPSLDDIRVLAKALNVHPSWLAFGDVGGEQITPDERDLLIAYRSISPHHKQAMTQLNRPLALPAPYPGPERVQEPRSDNRDPAILQKLSPRD